MRRPKNALAIMRDKKPNPLTTSTKEPLFSGAAPHPHRNLGHYLHPSKKRKKA